jgi:hypothetical protein
VNFLFYDVLMRSGVKIEYPNIALGNGAGYHELPSLIEIITVCTVGKIVHL